MADGKISYDAGKHEALESELKKIGDNFGNLITELEKLKKSVDEHLEGNATTNISTELSNLLTKLNTEKESWSTVSTNANQIETLIKEADKKAQQTVNGN